MSNKYGVLVLNLHLEFEINMIKLIKQATHIALGLVLSTVEVALLVSLLSTNIATCSSNSSIVPSLHLGIYLLT